MSEVKRYKSRGGYLLAFVAGIIVVLVLLGGGLLALGSTSRIKAVRSTSDIMARAAADAGLTRCLYLLNQKAVSEEVWDNSTLNTIYAADEQLEGSNEYYSFNVTGDPSGFTITSVGRSGMSTRTVTATTVLRSVFDGATVVKKTIVLYPNSSVIGYNSSTGVGVPARVGTNSITANSIVLSSGSSVDGDLLIGVGGDPEVVIDNNGQITGESTQLSSPMNFPGVEPPAMTGPDMNLNVMAETLLLNAGDSGRYGSISLSNQGMIEIDGDVVIYVTGDIDLGNECEITIKLGSSLVIYLDGDYEGKNGSSINNENSLASKFKLFGTGGPGQMIDLKAKSDFYGAVYAPNASMEVKAKGDIYGSFVGMDFEMKSKSVFHYDEALSSSGIDDEGVYFTISRWREE